MSPRGRETFLATMVRVATAALILLGSISFLTLPTPGVHDLVLLELDRDALDGNGTGGPPDDWNTFFPLDSNPAQTKVFLTDTGTEDRVFSGKGSTDTREISLWRHVIGNVADRDKISDAFAAAYATGGTRAYFGLDRFSNVGEARLGFWFLQNPITANTNGTFSGLHAIHDVLVLARFSQTGTLLSHQVLEWNPPEADQIGGTLKLLYTGADCVGAASGDLACTTGNQASTSAPWAYTPKAGSTGTFPVGSFFEGGVDLSTVVPGGIGCVSRFLAETRAGSAVDAPLSDFALGSLSLCQVAVTASGPAQGQVGDVATYTITVTNAGVVSLYLQSITDTLLGDLTGSAGSAACGTIAAGNSCAFSVSRTIQAYDPDPLVGTVTATYKGRQDLAGAGVSGSATHSVNLFVAALAVTKSGPAGASVGENITYTFTLQNSGAADSPPLILDSVSDPLIGDLTTAAAGCQSLAVGIPCTFTASRVVQASDPNPLSNTVTVHTHPQGASNDISATASHSLTVGSSTLTLTRGGPALSQVGESVAYSFTLGNSSASGTPSLLLDSVSDALLGDLTAVATAAGCGSLAPGASCTFTVSRVVQAGDPDPLSSTTTAHTHPEGASGDVVAFATFSVNLFQPALQASVTAPALAQVGDTVSYTITLTSTSSADAPALLLDTVFDTLLGDLNASATAAGCGSLAPGAACTLTTSRVVQSDDPDPLASTLSALTHPQGFSNGVAAGAEVSVNLFQPGLTAAVSAPPLSATGETVAYSITLTNSGSADAPALLLDSVVDTLIGDLTASAIAAGCGSVPAGTSCSFTASRVVQSGDPDPLTNTLTAHTHPQGFSNDVSAAASASVNLYQPALTVGMTATPTLSTAGDTVTYTVALTNAGSADAPALLLDSVSDTLLGDLTASATAAGCGSVTTGTSCSFSASRIVQSADPDPLTNTLTAHVHSQGFVSDVAGTAGASINLFQSVVDATVDGPLLTQVGETVTYTITLSNSSSADAPSLLLDSVSDTLLGDLTAVATAAGCGTLATGGSCSFSTSRVVQSGDLDPLADMLTVHMHPQAYLNDITASETFSVNLFQPAVGVTKAGPTTAVVGNSATYTFTLQNSGSADSPPLILDSVADSLLGDLTAAATGAGCGNLAIGTPCSFTASRTVQGTDPDPLSNTATAHAHPQGFSNDLSAGASHSVSLDGTFTCSRMIGFSQTRDFYPLFEAQVDGSKWEGLVVGQASIDYWADPNYSGWSLAVTSPCASGSGNPDRVVLHITAKSGQKPAKTEAWYEQQIAAAIANIRAKYPAVVRIDLMPIVGGPQHQVCTLTIDGRTQQVWASETHVVVDAAIADSISGDVLASISPEVASCAQYRDFSGHLTPEGNAYVGGTVGQWYAGQQ